MLPVNIWTHTLHCSPGALYVLCELDHSLYTLNNLHCIVIFASLLHLRISHLCSAAKRIRAWKNAWLIACVMHMAIGESMWLHANVCVLHACKNMSGAGEVQVWLELWLLINLLHFTAANCPVIHLFVCIYISLFWSLLISISSDCWYI